MTTGLRSGLLAFCAIAIFTGSSANGQHGSSGKALSMTGTDLYNNCTTKIEGSPDWVQASLCLGYVAAITDSLAAGNAVGGYRSCIPAGADMNQIIDIAKNAVKNQPERRHLLASGLLAQAFSRAFPCRS